MAERHGKNGRVIIGGTVVVLTKWTMAGATDKTDVSGFGDTNKRYVTGKADKQGTLAGFWNDANDAIFDAADGGVPVSMYLYPDAVNAAAQFWSGTAYLDASIDVDSNAAVAISGTWAAATNWNRAGVA